jgi:hypothetical protein
MKGIEAQELRELLEAIERGDVTLTTNRGPEKVYAGNVVYRASNGWTIQVFNDCGDWDYLDYVEAPDGRSVDYPSHSGELSEVEMIFEHYTPPPEVIEQRYHWNGGGRR